MNSDKPIILKRDCAAVLVPSGENTLLGAGSTVWLTQSLGGSYTAMTELGHMVHIDGQDGDALGMAAVSPLRSTDPVTSENIEAIEKRVWNQLRSCFDPEIPVNIVDLGLIYHCGVTRLAHGGYRSEVRFTLTAQGCGMGQFLKEDIRRKLLAIAAVREVEVELVWDPPWGQSMISDAAKLQLGIE
ncbi:MAG: putative Fe-S cluster assembly protein SufT [Candidatus Binatia bacterium]